MTLPINQIFRYRHLCNVQVRFLLSLQQPTLQTNSTHQRFVTCTCSYSFCFKRHYDMYVVEMMVRPPHESCIHYTHVHVHVHVHLHIHIHIHVHIHIHIRIRIPRHRHRHRHRHGRGRGRGHRPGRDMDIYIYREREREMQTSTLTTIVAGLAIAHETDVSWLDAWHDVVLFRATSSQSCYIAVVVHYSNNMFILVSHVMSYRSRPSIARANTQPLYTCIHVYLQTCIHTCIHAYIQTYIMACRHAEAYNNPCVQTYDTGISTWIVYTCINTCIDAYISLQR